MAAPAAAKQKHGTADLIAEMELAIKENNGKKVAELLAKIRCRVADPVNPAQYPERRIKGLIIVALKNKKLEIAYLLYNDLPHEIQKKYWRLRPETILELQCAVENSVKWEKIVGFPRLVVETNPLWIKIILDRNPHQLNVEESLRVAVENLRHQKGEWEALDLLLQLSKSTLQKQNVDKIFCETRWGEHETGPEPDKTVYRELLRWMEKEKRAASGEIPDSGFRTYFRSFADCAPNLFMGCIVFLMEHIMDDLRTTPDESPLRNIYRNRGVKLLSIIVDQEERFQQRFKETCGDLFEQFRKIMPPTAA